MASKKGIQSSMLGQILYGSAVNAVRSQASTKQWQRIVKAARQRGVTIDSLISGVPAPLQARTQSGILAQAKKTVASQYKPVFDGLSSQKQQVQALDAKRASDNQQYRDWLAQQSGALRTARDTFASAINERQQSLADQIQANYATAAQQAAANNAARTGSTTLGNQEQTAAQSAVSPQQNYAGALANNQQQATLAAERSGGDRLAVATANSEAAQAATDAKRQSDTWKALQDIATELTKQTSMQSADTQKEVSRLNDQELTKANALMQNNMAQATLGQKSEAAKLQAALDELKLGETARHNKANEQNTAESNRIRAGALTLNISAQQFKQMESDRNYQLAVKKYGAAQAKDRYLRQHGLGTYAKNGASPTRPLTMAQQNKVFSDINQARGMIQALAAKKFPTGQIRSALASKGFSREIVNSAMDLESIGKLSSANVDALHRLGVKIQGRLPY